MSHTADFLASYDPLPQGLTLPDRITLVYQPVSCLAHREGRTTLLLHRRADGAPFVLKCARDGQEDLMEEFRILARLYPRHPTAIPAPADCFRAEGVGYLVRSYLPGKTLARHREERRLLSPADAVSLGRKLCRLLDHLHRMEPPVIHRDIKPENIILAPDGALGLIDFGIARQYKAGQAADTVHLGSRDTAPPEQYGYAQTDGRADLYALGMTLIGLLTGRCDREELKGVPRWLRRVLRKATAFSPKDRYPSAAALDRALARRPGRRSLIAAGLCLLAALTVGVTLGSPAHRGVDFESICLEQAVRAELNQPEGPITLADLERVERLALVGETLFSADQDFQYRIACYLDDVYLRDAPNGDVSDLSLLAQMPNLKELYLCRQQISDLSPLTDLSLTTLALCDNQIADLSPLQGMETLETLYFGGNPATDHGVLSTLTGLKSLNLDGHLVFAVTESLDFLAALDLRDLSISLLEPLDGDWTPLLTQQRLEKLHLWSPTWELLDTVSRLPHLKMLRVGNWPGGDLNVLSVCQSLELLGIYDGLERLDGAEHLTSLITLAVSNSAVSDLSSLAGHASLDYLVLERLPITDFSPLLQAPKLRFVQVEPDQLEQLEAQCPGHAFTAASR